MKSLVTKRDYVLEAIDHKKSSKVPYCIRLTGEAYNLYGDKLLSDFRNKDVENDLKLGFINKIQAVDLAIGNFISVIDPAWWDWDYQDMPSSYHNPYDIPDELPGIIRYDSDENIENMHSAAEYISKKYGTFNASLIYAAHWEKAYFTRGIENFLADFAAAPEFTQMLLDHVIDSNMKTLPKIAKMENLDGILFGSDWGTQNDLIISPEKWRQMLKQGEKRLYETAKENNKKVFVHSCGCILKILDDIVELGVDVLNPVQPECMDLRYLKETYGNKLTFWGGISTQKTLPYGTPDEVRKETEQVIKLLSDNGGYITCSSQEIQTDVPYENLKMLIETAKSFT